MKILVKFSLSLFILFAMNTNAQIHLTYQEQTVPTFGSPSPFAINSMTIDGDFGYVVHRYLDPFGKHEGTYFLRMDLATGLQSLSRASIDIIPASEYTPNAAQFVQSSNLIVSVGGIAPEDVKPDILMQSFGIRGKNYKTQRVGKPSSEEKAVDVLDIHHKDELLTIGYSNMETRGYSPLIIRHDPMLNIISSTLLVAPNYGHFTFYPTQAILRSDGKTILITGMAAPLHRPLNHLFLAELDAVSGAVLHYRIYIDTDKLGNCSLPTISEYGGETFVSYTRKADARVSHAFTEDGELAIIKFDDKLDVLWAHNYASNSTIETSSTQVKYQGVSGGRIDLLGVAFRYLTCNGGSCSPLYHGKGYLDLDPASGVPLNGYFHNQNPFGQYAFAGLKNESPLNIAAIGIISADMDPVGNVGHHNLTVTDMNVLCRTNDSWKETKIQLKAFDLEIDATPVELEIYEHELQDVAGHGEILDACNNTIIGTYKIGGGPMLEELSDAFSITSNGNSSYHIHSFGDAFSLRLFDIMGNLVVSKTNTKSLDIELNTLPKGVYILTAKSTKGEVQKRLLN